MSWCKACLETVFGLDLRSLAIARILMSLVILWDVFIERLDLIRWSDDTPLVSNFDFFYTERGTLPQQLVREWFGPPSDPHWSLFFCSWSDDWTQFCFLLLTVSTTSFGLGYKTRFSNFALWLMTSSLQIRAPHILTSGDIILRVFLFWMMFLNVRTGQTEDEPSGVGAVYSIDSILFKRKRSRRKRQYGTRNRNTKVDATTTNAIKSKSVILSGGSAAFTMQLVIIYSITVLFKNHDYWKNGDAVNIVMQFKSLVRYPWFADFVLSDERIWKFMTWSTYKWEWYGAVFSLIPSFVPGLKYLRTFVVFTFISMHVGFHIGMILGVFPAICIVYWVALLPGSFWDSVGWTLDLNDMEDPKNKEDSVSTCISTEAEKESSDVSENHGIPLLLERSFSLAEQSWNILICHIVPLFLMLCVVIPWNLVQLPPYGYQYLPLLNFKLRGWQRAAAIHLQLEQNWNMFSPHPPLDDGWLLLSGQLFDGTQLDLWTDGFMSAATDELASLSSKSTNAPRQPREVAWASIEEQSKWNITMQTISNEMYGNISNIDDEATKLSFMLSRKRPNGGMDDTTKNPRWNKYTETIKYRDGKIREDIRHTFIAAICGAYNENLRKLIDEEDKIKSRGRKKYDLKKKSKLWRKRLTTVLFTHMTEVTAGPGLPKHDIRPSVLKVYYCHEDEPDPIQLWIPPATEEEKELQDREKGIYLASKLNLKEREREEQRRQHEKRYSYPSNEGNGSDLKTLLSQGNMVEFIRKVIKNPGSVHETDEEGWTIFHYAIMIGNIDVVKLLLSRGVDKDVLTGSGIGPLNIARDLKMIEYLEEIGSRYTNDTLSSEFSSDMSDNIGNYMPKDEM